jgi:hypothetical protein
MISLPTHTHTTVLMPSPSPSIDCRGPWQWQRQRQQDLLLWSWTLADMLIAAAPQYFLFFYGKRQMLWSWIYCCGHGPRSMKYRRIYGRLIID